MGLADITTIMATIMVDFHFLRPQWLWLLVPFLLLAWYFLKQYGKRTANNLKTDTQWQSHVDNHLLPYLLVNHIEGNHEANQHNALSQVNKRRRWHHFAIYLSIILTILALSAPTWQQKPVPAVQSNQPTMLVLSLAQSMSNKDIKPTRLKRAVHKIRDILQQTQGDQRGLVIYSDMAFTAAPLTNDTQVIQQMLPELSTELMPVIGEQQQNKLYLAVNQASTLLQRGGASSYTGGGHIIVITDSIGDDADKTLQEVQQAHSLGYTVSVLGVGAESNLDSAALSNLAQAGGGIFRRIAPSTKDVNALLDSSTQNTNINIQVNTVNNDINTQSNTKTDINRWIDMGYWLLLIPLLLIPFAFRSSWVSKL